MIQGEDKEAIDEKLKVMSELSAPIMQRMYAEQAAEAGAPEGEGAGPADDNVMDAEFTDVTDEAEADSDADADAEDSNAA